MLSLKKNPISKFDILIKEGTTKNKQWLIIAGPGHLRDLESLPMLRLVLGHHVAGKLSNKWSMQHIQQFSNFLVKTENATTKAA